MSDLSILVLQGPNLNLLGNRESSIYGLKTLDSIHEDLKKEASVLGVRIDFFQTNHEGQLIDRIHQAGREKINGIIINAASLTHTSIGIRDALAAAAVPFVEIHISNVYAREEFRHKSYISSLASGIVIGFGPDGYSLALSGLVKKLRVT